MFRFSYANSREIPAYVRDDVFHLTPLLGVRLGFFSINFCSFRSFERTEGNAAAFGNLWLRNSIRRHGRHHQPLTKGFDALETVRGRLGRIHTETQRICRGPRAGNAGRGGWARETDRFSVSRRYQNRYRQRFTQHSSRLFRPAQKGRSGLPQCRQLNLSPIFLRRDGRAGSASTGAGLRPRPALFASAEREAE